MENRVAIEELRKHIKYDAATGVLTWIAARSGRKCGDEAGHKDQRGYRRIFFAGRNYKSHIVAWAIHHGDWPEMWIDHKNGVRDDNRIENLRLATPTQNNANRSAKKNGTSPLKGVYFKKDRSKWSASIGIDGETKYLGSFDDEVQAHEAYANAATQYYREYARC